MGLLDFFSSNVQPENDVDWGREAVKFFHNRMASNFSNYTISMDELIRRISTYTAGNSQPDIFLDGLGFAISSNNMSESQVQDAMEKLADISGGNIPSNPSVFEKALTDRLQNITAGDWIGAAPTIAAETAATALSGIQAVGDSVIATGKTLTAIAPFLIVGAVIFIVYARARQIGGR